MKTNVRRHLARGLAAAVIALAVPATAAARPAPSSTPPKVHVATKVSVGHQSFPWLPGRIER